MEQVNAAPPALGKKKKKSSHFCPGQPTQGEAALFFPAAWWRALWCHGRAQVQSAGMPSQNLLPTPQQAPRLPPLPAQGERCFISLAATAGDA